VPWHLWDAAAKRAIIAHIAKKGADTDCAASRPTLCWDPCLGQCRGM